MQEKNRDLPVGFCDSGVGGLSVFSKFKKSMPYEDTIYFGDLKNVPYGSKTPEEIKECLTDILDFFETKKVKAVVLACNTTSAVAYDSVKDNYDFIIYPIIQSCAKVLGAMNINRLGVFATSATINSGAYAKEIKKYNSGMEIFSKACPGWVEIVENKTQHHPESIALIDKYLNEMLEYNPEKIVIGCTHYPFLLEILEKRTPAGMFIDPANAFTEFIKKDLETKNLTNPKKNPGKEEFYVSANPEQFIVSGKLFYEISSLPNLIINSTI